MRRFVDCVRGTRRGKEEVGEGRGGGRGGMPSDVPLILYDAPPLLPPSLLKEEAIYEVDSSLDS